MDRQQLEKLSVSELQDEAKKYGLNPPNDTSRCIDMIMSYLERQATSDLQKRETRAATKTKAMQSTVAVTTPTGSSDLSQICAWMAEQMRIQQEDKQEQRRLQQEQMRIQQEDKQEQRRFQQELMRLQQEDKQEQRRIQQEQMRLQQQEKQEQMRIQQEDKQEQRRIQQEQTLIQQEFQREQARNQQEQQRQNQAMMQQMVELTNLSRENSQNGIRNITSEDNVIRADPDSSITRRQPISSATAYAVKLLTTQIPEFAGTEEEKIETWIQTGERIAQIHAVSDDVLLLAASSKLVKNAKRWFDLNVTTLIESWQIFKEAIIRRFKRKILFHVAMQKVEARRWNFPKEQFQDYTMDKLVLMKNLNLPEEDAIHLLINGIGSRSLREAAAVLHCATVDEFLEEMHRITSVSAEPTRKIHHQEIKNDKVKNSEDTVPKDSSVSKSDKDVFCVYCRAKGHVRADCYKLKKKEQSPPVVTAKPASVVSAVEEDVQEMEIATVNEDSGRKLEIPDARIIVTSVNEIPYGLVFHKGKDKPRFVVPEVMINNIIRVYHDDKAHCDVNKTFQ
ncbi:uncharacterized protein LOC112459926, partial [Temnothorax curvispinosus]|uniref:Uncharacterized protein LOC112459926 n=1 Tax=Temnothorax curvispinosus TaxID=300111 RepID=A0A6J1QHE5_9HYME